MTHAFVVASTLATLAACTNYAHPAVVGYSPDAAPGDIVTLKCGILCGSISDEDTKWKYDARCDDNTLLLDLGRYEVGLFEHGRCDYPLWYISPSYTLSRVRLLPGHHYAVENRNGALGDPNPDF